MDRERRALTFALLPSLAVHLLLLSLNFGGLEPGLPGLVLPWRDRRGEAPELRVLLPAPSPQPVPEEPRDGEPAATLEASPPAPAPPTLQALPELLALAAHEASEFRVPVPPPAATAATAAPVAASASAPEPAAPSDDTARLEAERLEAERQQAARLEAARLEAERAEAARLEAARAEARRQEAARQEQARIAAARQEAERLEAQRLEAARVEAARLEAARLEAARLETARLEAAKAEAARQEASKLEAARQEAARQDAARVQAARDEEEARLARRRAMGRQLDAEAAQRAANALPSSWSSARRGRLFGRADPNVELVLYAEAWARRIQLNTPVATVQALAAPRHADPMVTVALRSDGSIESITFVVSSGVPEIDEGIRRIVQSLVPHPAFPPALAREYDVIEIRRTWTFDSAVRLF